MIRYAIIFVLALTTLSAAPKKPVYQVISSHPHDVQAFSPFIETIKKDGRVWLVHVKPGIPYHLMENFSSVEGRKVQTYFPDVRLAKLKMASPAILASMSRLSVAQIKSDVEHLASYRTRAAGTEDNQKTTNWIADEFTSLGYTVTRQCYRTTACSIIADKGGETASEDVILIMAHFDSVGKSFAGADDNASGTAVLMEIARALKGHRSNKTIRFFATNGEELGLLGAEHYARVLRESGSIKNVKFAINMDMVGYNSNGVVELETDGKFETLANWYASLVRQYTSLTPKITLGAWGSDHVPFLKSGVPTMLTIEDWSTKTPCYHMECDKPDTLNYEYAGEIAKLNLAAILTKDKELP